MCPCCMGAEEGALRLLGVSHSRSWRPRVAAHQSHQSRLTGERSYLVLARVSFPEAAARKRLGSNSDVASHRADGLFFRWIDVEVCRRFTGRMTATPELRPCISSAPTI